MPNWDPGVLGCVNQIGNLNNTIQEITNSAPAEGENIPISHKLNFRSSSFRRSTETQIPYLRCEGPQYRKLP